jgi:hypothetical protein
LKEQLMAEYPRDRGAYTEGKTAFVARILEAARIEEQKRQR